VDSLVNSLNPNRFKTFADFTTAGAFSRAGLAIPSYAVGTDYVPNDGLAMIHQGERIIPANENARMSRDNNNLMTTLINKVERLNRAVEAVANNTFKSVKIVQKWDDEGLPEERVV
jgi:hypothetical protein